MRKLERILKLVSFTIGTAVFSFLAWLMLVLPNFEPSASIVIGGLMVGIILFGVYRWGYLFIDDDQ